jgi:hypothetical protein
MNGIEYKSGMRRALASILLAVFSYPLVAAAFCADEVSGLKACCRRNGQHHCEMAGMDSSSDGPVALPAKCASWPRPVIALIDSQTPLKAASRASVSPLASFSATFISRDGVFSAISRASARKRGPPFLFD